MNKEKTLLKIIFEFTGEFCQNYVTSSSVKERMTSLALKACKEPEDTTLSYLQGLYQDYLDKNDLEAFPEYSLRIRRVKGIVFRPFVTFSMYKPFLASPEMAANAILCLIRQTRTRINNKTIKSALDYKGALLLNEI